MSHDMLILNPCDWFEFHSSNRCKHCHACRAINTWKVRERTLMLSTPSGFYPRWLDNPPLRDVLDGFWWFFSPQARGWYSGPGDFPARPLVRHCKIRSKWKTGSWSWALAKLFGIWRNWVGFSGTSPYITIVDHINFEYSWKNHP